MNKVGEHLRRVSLLATLSGAIALALPFAAGAQSLDPVLEQYAPSTQQINDKVKGDKNEQGDGEGEADAQDAQEGAVAEPDVSQRAVGGSIFLHDGRLGDSADFGQR